MTDVYKIYSLNCDDYYLLKTTYYKYKSRIINKIIFDYKKHHAENQKTKNDNLYIIIQKNNICIDKLKTYNNTYEANSYIYDIIKMDDKCINNKQLDYTKNDLINIILGVGKTKLTIKEKNKIQYLKRKNKKADEKELKLKKEKNII
mgnify:FL=1|jgi:hypothetical protein